MADAGRRQPAVNEPFHSLPTDASSLASMREHVMPELAHRETKVSESIPIARYSVVADMPAHDCCQPLADRRNGFMHASPQFGFHRLQLGLHALADRLPEHGEPSLTRFPADVRESEKSEGFRLPQTATLSVISRISAKLQKPGLFRVQFELELLHTFFQFRPEPLGIRPDLKAQYHVIGEPHDNDSAGAP